MTIVVSISQFRQNIADYLEKVKAGNTVILQDERKEQQIAKLVGKKMFNPQSFENALKAAVGVFTDRDHPEWKTKDAVIRWLEQERKSADRIF